MKCINNKTWNIYNKCLVQNLYIYMFYKENFENNGPYKWSWENTYDYYIIMINLKNVKMVQYGTYK